MADGRSNDIHVVDIDKWVASLEGILKDVTHDTCKAGHPGKITRIPQNLREVDIKAYEPSFLSMGPYHHGKPRVQRMEKRKLFALKCFLEHKPELKLQDFLKEIKSIELVARSFYSDVEMESEKFVQMLLVDSLFIISLFCGLPKTREGTIQSHTNLENEEDIETKDEDENKQMIAKGKYKTRNTGDRWFRTFFARDLFLLENQLPFFVLQNVYSFAYGEPVEQLLHNIKVKVSLMLSVYTKVDPVTVVSKTEEVHHLLHLCHMFFRPSLHQESTTCHLSESCQMFRLGNATQLYRAGVHFVARSCSTQHSLVDISFVSSGEIVMPYLHVDDYIVPLLRNLVALEQMKYPRLGLDISAYIVLLVHLVTIPQDVKLLRNRGILQHHLASDKEMMRLINGLSVGLSFDYMEDTYELKSVFQDLKRYSERKVPQWRAWLKHRYFNNPWTAISLLAASFFLLLSALQTYYAVYSYYHPYGHL